MPHELLTRRAALEPTTANAAERTVDVTFSTGAGVRRRDAAGVYEERLSLDPAHVDVAALVGGPLLDGHRQESVDRVLGVVTAAHVDGTRGFATLRFSERADAIWQDVRAGILRAVSVGYSVERWQDSGAKGTRVRTAVAWTPRELSLVPLPADAGATVRGDNMDPNTDPNAPADDTATRATTNVEIRRLARAAGLGAEVADSLIDREASVDAARAELFDAVLARPTPTVRHQRITVSESHDAPETMRGRMADALHARLTGTAPSDAAKPYMHRRLVDLATDLLEARGESLRMLAPDSILQRAGMHTSGDFPTLLTSTGNRILLAAFEAAPNPLKVLARRTTVTDFRTKTIAKLSEAPALLPVAEHGEITYGSRTESKEAYRIGTAGRLFAITRQALVNDDLSAFSDFSRAAGRAAAEYEASVLVALLTANAGTGPTLDDGNPLFHTSHANVAATGTAIDATALAAARLAMRTQKGLDGVTPVNATARYLLVSPTKETQAEQVLAPLVPAQTSNVNPFSNSLTLLVEPRLTGNRLYTFADPAALPVLEYAYLSSAPGPQMTSREGWDVLGQEFRIVLDFGAGVVDHRGAFTNAGA